MGITGLIPFLEKASRRANVGEFSGCTVAIDSYCWLHKGAFACADKLVRGEDTDIHIKYCMKYVTMLLSKNIKPILVFDGRHLPAKALTEAKRRESRNTSKKRAAELLSLGQIEEARSYIRRSVDITHQMALALMHECRRVRVDCIVAPHEADAQLAHLNIHNYAHCVITEDSDLILFGCTKVLFKMDLEGNGILVDTGKLPLVMKCPLERYSFDKFRQMCIMSGCDYLASLPGIGLAKARQFVNATQDSSFVNALRKLPSFFNKSSISVSDEYREGFLKAEATFKYQYVYDPIERTMKRLNDIDNPEVEEALCVNAGDRLEPEAALQLALGNLDPFTMKKVDNWHPDCVVENGKSQTSSWNGKAVVHPSIWSPSFKQYLSESRPWQKPEPKKLEPIITTKTRAVKKVVNLISKYVPETQDESLTIESLSNMYCKEPQTKKQKITTDSQTFTQESIHNQALYEDDISSDINTQKSPSPILENKERSYQKCIKNSSYSVLKRLSKFPRTIMDNNVVESKFFNTSIDTNENKTEDLPNNLIKSPESKNPFKINTNTQLIDKIGAIDSQCIEILDTQETLNSSQKENSPDNSPVKKQSPVLDNPSYKNPFRVRKLSEIEIKYNDVALSEDSVIENTYPMETLVTPVDSQISFGEPTINSSNWRSSTDISPPKPLSQPARPSVNSFKRSTCRVPGLKRTASLPSNQPTLLSKFGFQKKPVMKR